MATGAVVPSDAACALCGLARGYAYTLGAYAVEEVPEPICPWCIADGSAARRYDAAFSDAHGLAADVPREVVEEVTERTPSYLTWQSTRWLSQCGDACAVLGDASPEDAAAIPDEDRAALMRSVGLPASHWRHLFGDYRPGGRVGLYRFACRHCGAVLFTWDMT